MSLDVTISWEYSIIVIQMLTSEHSEMLYLYANEKNS